MSAGSGLEVHEGISRGRPGRTTLFGRDLNGEAKACVDLTVCEGGPKHNHKPEGFRSSPASIGSSVEGRASWDSAGMFFEGS